MWFQAVFVKRLSRGPLVAYICSFLVFSIKNLSFCTKHDNAYGNNIIIIIINMLYCNMEILYFQTPVTSKAFIGNMSYLIAYGVRFSAYCWFGNELTAAVSID